MSDTSVVLLDNATISSAFRSLGFAPCPNKSVFDLDIANLSTLVDAVLLADRVVVPATYLPKYQQERINLLSSAGVESLKLAEESNQELEQVSRTYFSRWTMDYYEGSSGISQEILRLADIYIKFVWNYRSSEYWLVLRALQQQSNTPEANKYAQIEGLLTEDNPGIWQSLELLNSANIFSTNGTPVTESNLRKPYVLRPGVKKLLAALSWNILRATYYRILAAKINAAYLPHSLRAIGATLDAISANDKIVSSSTLSQYHIGQSKTTITESLEKIMKATGEELASVGAVRGSICNSIPPLLGYVLNKATSKENFLEQLFCLRTLSSLQDLRNQLREFEANAKSGNIAGIRKWKNEVERTSSSVMREMGLVDTHFTLNPLTILTGGAISLNIQGLSVPKWLYRTVALPNNWKLWYREVAINLQNVARLGDSYEKIQSWASFKEEAQPNYWYAKQDYPQKYTRLLDDGIQQS
ncbi:hypothetical protein [Oscillatoria sp. FACHB-1406]|uniref:hypothetical protein n=1 Tax=Oscillatoria sp. FACHB-1406 TaxID=2692846 RepID=UPI001681D5DB|nr:hypothetical protein [Oscillatoria sp. FACHB-1406]MBD2577167.1 hypothetical protein [Oscillatoria sp. FACHB-1406]